ncbi:glycosyltransferase family 2 protein [uncultured Methanobrevibacter sp.]|uniref:glycosyltransferase family 2 protein n=1 Tax=uncultured Methanobrevibacter sp. TaxID=253161 RepID=UPI0025CFA4FD|nr:glycosyltransferase family 2 protein [uncultured Methanobrevibacter sp.]
MRPKISIIIPIYNGEKHLMDAVNSVIQQSIGFENIELILVDDNSSDNTKEILKKLSSNYENVKAIFLEGNSGTASRPRNYGIKNSTSEYIMFLDSDDELYPDCCRKLYNTITSENADVVCCRYNITSKNFNTPKSFLDKYDPYIKLGSVEEFPEIMTLGFPTMIWTKIFKKSTVLENEITFPEGECYEDVYFSVAFYLKANGIIILNDYTGYNYIVRTDEDDSSISQKFTKSLVKKQLGGFLKLMNLIDDKPEYNILKSELIVDMTKIYLYADLDKNCQCKFLKIMKPYYKDYKITNHIQTAGLPAKIIINLGIKTFSISTNSAIILSKLFSKIKSKN